MARVRIGFIGAGWWATDNHIPRLKRRDDVELAAVCRPGAETLELVRKEFGFGFATEDYRELLKQELDGVVVVSPHHLHYEHASAALACGCHVMCEKPMALRAAKAWELVELAERQERHLLVPYGWHYKPFLQQAKRLMMEGAVGEVQYVLCHMASPTIGLFTGDGLALPETDALVLPIDVSTWQTRSQGGGYAHGQLTHASALMFWLTGLRAKQVSAQITRPNSEVDLYNSASVIFENGAIGTMSGAGTLPEADKFQLDVRVFGEKGVLVIDVNREQLELRSRDGRHQRFEIPDGEGAYSCEGPPDRFIELIQGTGSNDSPGEVAARSVEMIDAMFRSADQAGAPVAV
ncbi:MAG: oxidoreductase [Planctomycetaceae bacterium]|nr:oxidoreductase [Planctomycetaceae bacterium]